MEGGVSGDLGLVIGLQDDKAGPGNVTILLLAMMDFLVLAIRQKLQLAWVGLIITFGF